MNWNLITKDKDGELQVNFFWICILITFVGFLFGLGVCIANFIVNFISDYFYSKTEFMFKMFLPFAEFALLLFVIVLVSQVILKMNKENKREER